MQNLAKPHKSRVGCINRYSHYWHPRGPHRCIRHVYILYGKSIRIALAQNAKSEKSIFGRFWRLITPLQNIEIPYKSRVGCFNMYPCYWHPRGPHRCIRHVHILYGKSIKSTFRAKPRALSRFQIFGLITPPLWNSISRPHRPVMKVPIDSVFYADSNELTLDHQR